MKIFIILCTIFSIIGLSASISYAVSDKSTSKEKDAYLLSSIGFFLALLLSTSLFMNFM